MSGYSVEIMVGIKDGTHTMHTWLEITRPNGTQEAWGLYPAQDGFGNWIYGPGEIRPEDTRIKPSASSGPLPMTSEQYYSFRGTLPTFESKPEGQPDYSIPYNKQCTQWALETLQNIGVLPDVPAPLLTIQFNPYTLYLDLKIYNAIREFWDWIQPRYSDPLAFDLDGDGLETLGIDTTKPIYFDHDGDGNQTATGWINSDDGLLVLDRNGNGTIDTGRAMRAICACNAAIRQLGSRQLGSDHVRCMIL